MTKQEDYPAQVADLIQQAFKSLGTGLASEHPADREHHLTEANARFQTAQAVATLAHAQETRILALATLAGLDPVKVQQAGQLPQEAYTAAAYALGLVEDEPVEPERLEELRRALMGESDPADADLGDLK